MTALPTRPRSWRPPRPRPSPAPVAPGNHADQRARSVHHLQRLRRRQAGRHQLVEDRVLQDDIGIVHLARQRFDTRIHDRGGRDHPVQLHVLGEPADKAVRLVEHDAVGRADLHDCAVAHDRDPIAHADGLVQIVGDEDDCLVHRLL